MGNPFRGGGFPTLQVTPRPARRQNHPRGALAFGLLISLALSWSLPGCINISLKAAPGPLKETVLSGEGSDKILLTDISGFISGKEQRESLLDNTLLPSLTARIKEELDKAAQDDRVRAVVLRISSPGGLVTASDMIHHEIQSFREKTGRPVVASLMDLATSGAYYIALSADRILAHPTTVTGSIGVIMVRPDVEGLMQMLGIRATEIKSGDLKAMGSPFKPISPEERRIFQAIIDEMHGRFIEVLLQGRPGLSQEKARSLADGRIYAAGQALEAGLVDEIGYLSGAIAAAQRLADAPRARVIMYHRPGDFRGSVYASSPSPDPSLLTAAVSGLSTPRFMYLWMP